MGFPKSYASTILGNVFKAGNTIALLSAVNTENDTYTKCSGDGYKDYTILNGDFTIANGIVTTARNILYGLAEGGWGTCVGIAVFGGSSLLYLAELSESKPIGKDTVPVFRTYAAASGSTPQRGLKITLDVVTTGTMSVNDPS